MTASSETWSTTTMDLVTKLAIASSTSQAINSLTSNDRFGRVSRKGPGETAQPGKDALLGLREQRVGPLHGGPQGLVAFDRGPTTTRQEPEPLIEAGPDLMR